MEGEHNYVCVKVIKQREVDSRAGVEEEQVSKKGGLNDGIDLQKELRGEDYK